MNQVEFKIFLDIIMGKPSLSLNKPCSGLSAGDEHQGIHVNRKYFLKSLGSLSLSLCVSVSISSISIPFERH